MNAKELENILYLNSWIKEGKYIEFDLDEILKRLNKEK